MKIYVGNLSAQTMEDDLRQTFEVFGDVSGVNITTEVFSGQCKRFGYVEMPSKFHASAAISELNGLELNGRRLSVFRAYPQPEYQPSYS